MAGCPLIPKHLANWRSPSLSFTFFCCKLPSVLLSLQASGGCRDAERCTPSRKGLPGAMHSHTAGPQLPWIGRAWQCTAAVVAAKFPAVQKGQLFLIKFEVRRLKAPERKLAPHIAKQQCAEKRTLQCFELLICLLSQQRPGPSSIRSRLLFNALVSFTQCTERVFVVNRLQIYQTFSPLPR